MNSHAIVCVALYLLLSKTPGRRSLISPQLPSWHFLIPWHIYGADHKPSRTRSLPNSCIRGVDSRGPEHVVKQSHSSHWFIPTFSFYFVPAHLDLGTLPWGCTTAATTTTRFLICVSLVLSGEGHRNHTLTKLCSRSASAVPLQVTPVGGDEGYAPSQHPCQSPFILPLPDRLHTCSHFPASRGG